MISVRAAADAYCPGFLVKWKSRVLASSLGYRLARGAFWSLVGSLISRGMGMVAGIVVARILGKHYYGQLGIVQSTVGMFGVFAGFGMGLTANKHIAEFKTADPVRAGRVIGLSSLVSWATSGIMALGLFFAAPLLARRTLADSGMAPLLQIASFLLLFSGVNGAQTGALAGFEAFKTIARVNLIAGLLAFPITLACAWWGGVPGSVWALAINMAAVCLLNFLALRQEAAKASVPLGYRNCWDEWSILWTFSLPAVLSGAVSGPATWATNALLVNQHGGYAEMGVFTAVQRIRIVPEMVLAMLLAPLLPVLSERFSSKEPASYQRAARSAFALSLLVTAPVALILLAFPSLTLAPYGRDYAGQAPVVQWAMADLAIMGVFTPLNQIVASMNRMWFGFGYNLAYALTCVGLSVVLVPDHGAAGLAAAITIAHAILLAPCLWYIYRMEKELICGTSMWEVGAALAATCGAIYLVARWLPALLVIALFVSSLAGFLWLRKQFSLR